MSIMHLEIINLDSGSGSEGAFSLFSLEAGLPASKSEYYSEEFALSSSLSDIKYLF